LPLANGTTVPFLSKFALAIGLLLTSGSRHPVLASVAAAAIIDARIIDARIIACMA